MATVLGRRFLGAIPVLLVLTLVVFILQKVAPVDPVAALVGEKAAPDVYAAARHKLWLDRPLPVQFGHYIMQAVRGNLGQSSVTRTPVAADISKFLPVTLELVFTAMLLVVIIGFFLGLATAQGWRGSGALRFVMVSGASVPVFLACLIGMVIFYRWLNLLPITGQTSYYDTPTGPTHFLLIDSLLAGRSNAGPTDPCAKSCAHADADHRSCVLISENGRSYRCEHYTNAERRDSPVPFEGG